MVRNDSSDNCGDGITVRNGSMGNVIVNNEMRGNPNTVLGKCTLPPAANFFFDANDTGAVSDNNWNNNNKCLTESGSVPGTVCNPGE